MANYPCHPFLSGALSLPALDFGVRGSCPAGGKIVSKSKRHLIAESRI